MDALKHLSILEQGLLAVVAVAAAIVIFWFFNRKGD